MFCNKGSKALGGHSKSVLSPTVDGNDKNARKVIYLGMSKEEYLKLFHGSFFDRFRKDKERKKITYIAHASWEDIGIKKSSRKDDNVKGNKR